MNLLLVDDEEWVLQELMEQIRKMELSFERVFVADCVEEARKILETVPIQVMLCDIEMPGGSGLELLAWIREKEIDLQCIFLTNYADFSYAKKAISLDSMEYLLKPASRDEIYMAIVRALEKVNRSRLYEQAKSYWLDTGREARDSFWKHTLSETEQIKQDEMEHFGYLPEDGFLLAALKACSLSSVEKLWGSDMFEYVLKNVLFELLDCTFFQAESVFSTTGEIWIIVCSFPRATAPDSVAVEEAMEEVVHACEEKLHLEMWCAVGYACAAEKLHRQMTELTDMMENILDRRGKVLRLEEYSPGVYVYQTPEFSVWECFLRENQKETLARDIRRYLEKKVREGWSRQQLLSFRQDVTQMFYSFLRDSSIQAHKLFAGKEMERLYQRSCNSVQDMLSYCDYLTEQVIDYKKLTEQPDSLMEKILKYVDEHYCEDISRNDLVNLVYISPDYCSRLFKKQTGKSLAQYVLEKRMEKAKKLLQGEMSVKNVALQTGYNNFSYFSKVFREMTGMTPGEYREKTSY